MGGREEGRGQQQLEEANRGHAAAAAGEAAGEEGVERWPAGAPFRWQSAWGRKVQRREQGASPVASSLVAATEGAGSVPLCALQ